MRFSLSVRLYLGLAVCIAIPCGGCNSSEDGSSVQTTAISNFPDPNDLPEGWASSELSLNHSFSGDLVDIVMKGKNTTLRAAIESIRDRLSMPVIIDENVDKEAKIDNLEIYVKSGSWDDLPKKIADSFGLGVTTRDGEVVIMDMNE